jgi:hypothetical protein
MNRRVYAQNVNANGREEERNREWTRIIGEGGMDGERITNGREEERNREWTRIIGERGMDGERTTNAHKRGELIAPVSGFWT